MGGHRLRLGTLVRQVARAATVQFSRPGGRQAGVQGFAHQVMAAGRTLHQAVLLGGLDGRQRGIDVEPRHRSQLRQRGATDGDRRSIHHGARRPGQQVGTISSNMPATRSGSGSCTSCSGRLSVVSVCISSMAQKALPAV